jgi:hypothetical protein
MTAPSVQCDNCRVAIPAELFNRGAFAPCPSCATAVWAELFPAFQRPLPSGHDGAAVLTEEEAACFYHPRKQAVVPCDACGRFLCALCDCELKGRHLCPGCLERGRKEGKLRGLEHQRLLYDNIALSLAIYPLLIFYLTLFTAPMVVYLSIRHWNSPSSILPRTKVRYVIALLLALMQIGGWTFVFTRFLLT